MKINASRVQYLIKEYSANVKKAKSQSKGKAQDTVGISGDGKRKMVFEKTANGLLERLVKNSNTHQKK